MAAFTANDKPYGISQIKAYIPITLDMSKLNYDKWRELFETHCVSFGVVQHLDGSSTPTPKTEKEWKERDGLVKMWIYGTISDSIIDTILKKNATARDLWLSIESLFRDNKEARALQLENELRTMVIGDLSIHDYCQKMKTTADLLANIDAPVSERALVSHLLNGLSDKFDSIINVVQHKVPFPTLLEARSMLQMEETRLSKQTKPTARHHDTQSSSTVLCTETETNPRNFNNSGRGNRGRNRGGNGGNRSRGKGRFSNNWQHNQPNQFASPWYYPQQPPVYPPNKQK